LDDTTATWQTHTNTCGPERWCPLAGTRPGGTGPQAGRPPPGHGLDPINYTRRPDKTPFSTCFPPPGAPPRPAALPAPGPPAPSKPAAAPAGWARLGPGHRQGLLRNWRMPS